MQFVFFIASLGLLKIFDHFLKLTDLVGNMPPVLRTLAQDLVDDIRRLIPEVEKIAAKYNATESILQEVGNAMNITRVTHEYLPQLAKIMEDENLSETIKEIVGYLNIDRVKYELLPEMDKLLKENNVSQILDEIKAFLNVTVIADILLPEVERFVANVFTAGQLHLRKLAQRHFAFATKHYFNAKTKKVLRI